MLSKISFKLSHVTPITLIIPETLTLIDFEDRRESTFYPSGTPAYLHFFFKWEARYSAPLIFDIHGAAHAGRSQEYLMERGEAPASAQINSR